MKIETLSFSLQSKGNTDIIDITDEVQTRIKSSGFDEGNALIFASGATAGITTIEYEPGLLKDYPEFMEKIIPTKHQYKHNETWQDENGHSHLRSSLQGASFTVPFLKGKLLLGSWQQIIFIDFDNRPRKRNIVLQLIGNKKQKEIK
jgi:secondary thiamine-phosphate synthase enzyme